ncbi:MAG: hypothetical protein HC800_02655 [Phormidesmis sp. RL_2_1]|nr:hypothetical protein [Phormidesmis sp. RL_2_1]
MVVDEFESWLAKAGIAPLSVEKATAALGELLAQEGCIHSTVVDVDWRKFKALFELRGPRPLLSSIAVAPNAVKAASGSFLRSLQMVPPAQQRDRLTAFLQAEVARIMGLPAGQKPPLFQGFFEMGLDSLMAVELKTQLEDSFACELPGTLVFEVPTIYELTDYFADQVLGWRDAPEPTSPASDPPLPLGTERAAIAQMSETDIEASIAAQLARLESLVGGQ